MTSSAVRREFRAKTLGFFQTLARRRMGCGCCVCTLAHWRDARITDRACSDGSSRVTVCECSVCDPPGESRASALADPASGLAIYDTNGVWSVTGGVK